MGSPIWAAAARTLALFAATASKCEIIGRNFTWEIWVHWAKLYLKSCCWKWIFSRDIFCCDLHVAEKKGRGWGGNFAETSDNRHRRKSDHKKEVWKKSVVRVVSWAVDIYNQTTRKKFSSVRGKFCRHRRKYLQSDHKKEVWIGLWKKKTVQVISQAKQIYVNIQISINIQISTTQSDHRK